MSAPNSDDVLVPPPGPIFVTGATGYIGGRLVPRLLEAGYRVRCLTRTARKLEERPWGDHPLLEVVEGDVGDTEGLARAMSGCRAAYYLVHSMMIAGEKYRERDRQLARSYATAARDAGIERTVYLGGLGETGEELSEHLSSRREVEERLAETGVPVTTLRAAMIIGSGSASFEILRYLVERLPAMITPRWVSVESQPIAVRNVLHYLVAVLTTRGTTGEALDIGGPDIRSYRDLMQEMARGLGLRRRIIVPVPVLTPRLSSAWIHLVTPVSARIARPLAEGLRNRVVCRDDRAARLMPQRLLTVREAIEAALGKVQRFEVETKWSGAGPIPGDPDWAGGTVLEDRRSCTVASSAENTFAAFTRLGGEHGYYAFDWLWAVRGWLDRLVGGPGLRRGRRDPQQVAFGEALDFWRVTGIVPGRSLQLRAEMRVPGIAILEFEALPSETNEGESRLVQTARFKPKGLWGLVYWYSVLPLHAFVFEGLMRGIAREAEATKEVDAESVVPSGADCAAPLTHPGAKQGDRTQ